MMTSEKFYCNDELYWLDLMTGTTGAPSQVMLNVGKDTALPQLFTVATESSLMELSATLGIILPRQIQKTASCTTSAMMVVLPMRSALMPTYMKRDIFFYLRVDNICIL